MQKMYWETKTKFGLSNRVVYKKPTWKMGCFREKDGGEPEKKEQ